MKQAEFKNTPKEYAVTPFWGWNDDLQEEEVVRQVGEFNRAGWGGFFIHARDGMVTPFLGKKWMSCIKAAAGEASKLGIDTWIYDEHFAPSGFAGGIVPAKGPEYRQKVLVCRAYNQPMHLAEEIKCFAAGTQDGLPVTLEDITGLAEYDGGADQFLNFYMWTEPLGNPQWYYGFSYIDAMDPKVTDAFIEAVYEGHRKALGDDFDKLIRGYFTDMASFIMHLSELPRPCVPWTPGLPDAFKAQYGYDLLEHLPSLFYDLGDYHKVRVDYWNTVAALFRENFIGRIHQWCKKNNVSFSGHLWGEEMLHWQVQWTGSTMALLEHFDLPAVDHVIGNIDDPMGMKQGDSVVCQLGRPRYAVETYALSGPAFSFEDRKWIGDWECVLGANFLIPYIPAYSLRGMRKHDEPPSLFFQQPWWYQNRYVDDYFGRLCYALTQGKRVVDILILHPLESVMALHKSGPGASGGIRNPMDVFEGTTPEALAISNAFSRLSEDLLKSHRDFHYGDEILIDKYGSVESGKFRIGEYDYPVVIVPPSLTWRKKTWDLLMEYAKQGGKVIAVKPLPTMINCEPAGQLLPPSAIIIDQDAAELKKALDSVLAPDVRLDPKEIWYHHRQAGDQDIFFFANTSQSDGYMAQIDLKVRGAVEELDPVYGEAIPVPSVFTDGYSRISLWFPPTGSRLLVVNAAKEPIPAPVGENKISSKLEFKGEWELKRLDPNALVLDYCQLELAGSDWNARSPVFAQSRAVQSAGVGVPYRIRFSFDVRSMLQGKPLYLVLEDQERFKIEVNGTVIENKPAGWWVDTTFKKLDITKWVKEGTNTIMLSARSRPKRRHSVHDSEFEICYLTGHFGVDLKDNNAIVTEPDLFTSGNLVEQGYPFYVGRMVLSQKVHVPKPEGRIFLQLEGLHAVIAEVRINGSNAGRNAWQPHTVEVTGLVREGENLVEVEIANSLYNLLGPHHSPMGLVKGFVFHMHFDNTFGWKDDYTCEPFGLNGARLVTGSGPEIDVFIEKGETAAARPTARQLVEGMVPALRAENARGDHAVIQIKLSGEQGGSWYVTIKDGVCTVDEGVSDQANVCMEMDADDYVDMGTGKLDGMKAVMSGKLKVSGDMGILTKMQAWFPNNQI